MKNSPIKKSYKIAQLIKMISEGEFVLPEIQREFVWDLDRIAELWDSIYRGYPIGQLLFWRANLTAPTYSFFDVLQDGEGEYLFINRRPHWNHKNQERSANKIIVLDGQQRLTSLFLGVSPNGVTIKRRSNSTPEKRYLCIYKGKEDADGDNDTKLFSWEKEEENSEYISIKKALDSRKQSANIHTLKQRLFSSATAIPVDYARGNDISDVIEIFRRLNNNGRNMNKSELFLAMWFGSDKANDLRGGLAKIRESFGNEFDVKDTTITQLLITVFGKQGEQQNKIEYSSSAEMFKRISSELPNLEQAVMAAVDFLHNDCGIYSNDEMTSHSLFIPIVQLFYKFDCKPSEKLRAELRCFTYRALVFDLFSKSTNNVLSSMKKAIDKSDENGFIENIKDERILNTCFGDYIDNNKKQWLDEKVIELLKYEKGAKTNQLLLLIHQESDHGHKNFDQDHLIARDLFHPTTVGTINHDSYYKFGIRQNGEIIEKYQLTEAELREWKEISGRKENYKLSNALPNLWLLDSSENRRKGKKLLNIWYGQLSAGGQEDFWREAMLPKGTIDDLKITNFLKICTARESALHKALMQLLALPK